MVTLSSPIPFSAFPLDRAGARRRDQDFIFDLLRLRDTDLVLIQDGKPVLKVGGQPSAPRKLLRLAAASRAGFLQEHNDTLIFMGQNTHGRATFAASLPSSFDWDDGPLQGLGEIEDMRMAAGVMDVGDLAIAGTAKSILDWHSRHRFCANCGVPSQVAEAGWKRHCTNCDSEHFPRTDPVAIMLAVHGNRCLLGRGPGFRAGYVSALAGFIEPGETIEEGCARELHEEAGVTMTHARIVANQPWPFPSQLMIGLIASVKNLELTIDLHEISEAIWFTREEARALLSEGGCRRDGVTLRAPPPLAIAHHLIQHWIHEG
ncbi:NAD(+) diphosphatase [Candidatus Phycosocius spiralis]|uniref:NAD(+) diphosphatase n=1 Tax=Candidatus Phycosocius spiralis TaxID=2815099 RepID=A0ABQ4PSB3_9PROT|nr:NAD(+) diphosphatase [Candidatus Phycosocius spiralis]GIU65902.1 NADH pyrophosphatase [Candidatus Phycosocius spiralis]